MRILLTIVSEFLNRLSKEEKGDVSKAVRELVYKGRVMLAVERYKRAHWRKR